MKTSISITRIHDHEEGALAVLEQTEQQLQDVRHRAFDYFQQRGENQSSDWDDWLRAERDVLWRPHAEMVEKASAVVLRIAVPGLDKESVQVTATPNSLLVQG